MAQAKYYGVKVGRKSGVYLTWSACEKQVKGFGGALFKSFPTQAEAYDYVNGISQAVIIADDHGDAPAATHYDIYVDGSFDVRSFRYSWGFAVFEKGSGLIHQASGVGTDREAAAIRNVAGELQATMEAVAWAEEQNVDSITVHHDYIGIAEWATGKWKTNNATTLAYAGFIRTRLQWVGFNKVEAHTGVAGNELVDKLAREALQKGGI